MNYHFALSLLCACLSIQSFGQVIMPTPTFSGDNTILGNITNLQTPGFELEVYGEGTFSSAFWGRGLLMRRPNQTSNSITGTDRGSGIVWDRGTTNSGTSCNYFIAGPQNSAQAYSGDYFTGIYEGAAEAGGAHTYISRIDGNVQGVQLGVPVGTPVYGANDPKRGNTQYFRDVYLFRQNGFSVYPRLAINYNPETTTPPRSLQVDCQTGAGTGMVRFSCLPTIPPTKLIGCDDNGDLTYVPLTNGADCDWDKLSNGNVVTAHASAGSNGLCPEEDNVVGIGTTTPVAKLDVLGLSTAVNGTAIAATTNGGLGNITGISSVAQPVSGGGSAAIYRGVLSIARNSSLYNVSSVTMGEMEGSSQSCSRNYGLEAYGTIKNGASTGDNFGVWAKASNDNTATVSGGNFGVYAMATGLAPANYGLFATASGGTNNIAVYSNGDHLSTGTGTWNTSDARLKTDIEELSGSLEKLLELSPKKYVYDRTIHPGMNLPEGLQLGLIAQEVERVFPTLVMDAQHPATLDGNGKVVHESFEFKAMNYTGLIPVLIGSIQEQQAIIDDKQAQIDALNERLSAIEKKLMGSTGIGGLDNTKARLDQNAPNPFNENTVIRFFVPDGSQRASIQVMDVQGKEWKAFTNLTNGDGQLVIAAGSMPSGSYSYTLFVDGEKVATRTMVITQ